MLRIFVASLWLALFGFVLGCGNSTELKDQASTSENQLNVIMAPLYEDRPTIATYRTFMQNLNSYFDGLGDSYRNQIVLSPEQTTTAKQCLIGMSRFDEAKRLEEIKSKSFNASGDASHLDSCLLFRDAAGSLVADLGEPPPASDAAATENYQLELAQNIFGWMARQVVLKPHADVSQSHWPPHEVLRRGSGDVQERILVLLSILAQTDLPGCAILVKKSFQEDNLTVTRPVPVLAGVLIGKSIYLFDPQQGKMVIGPEGKGFATLAQLQQQADQPGQPSGLFSSAQLKNAEVVVYCSLPSLAPRMRVLEHEFDLQKNRVHLYDGLLERLARFKSVGIPVKPWNTEAKPGDPALLIEHYVENPQGDPRLVYLQKLRQKLVPAWALDMDRAISRPGTPQSLLYEFDRRFLSLLFEPGGGRDLLVRGRAAQAVAKIAKYENAIDRALDVFHTPSLSSVGTVGTFRDQYLKNTIELRANLAQAINNLNSAQSANAPSVQVRQLESECAKAQMAYEAPWKSELYVTMVNNLGSEWAMPELREHITYFIGLAKMELALQAERRWKKNPHAPWPAELPKPAEQFASASEWFRRYEALVLTMDSAVWLDAVKARRTECDQKQAELQQHN